ncbi:MAG: 4Fe-4S dicluster domain-containing protein [Promethearchaeota archaeon]
MKQNEQIWIKRNYETCSGCRRCEIACSLYHEGKIWPEASRIRIFMLVPGIEIPHLCFQCNDYPCVDACTSEALSINNKTGAININNSKCISCGLCIDACPGDVPHLHPGKDTIVICDLCGGTPKCVDVCQKGKLNALEVISKLEIAELEKLAEKPKELTIKVAKKILGEEILKEVLSL